MRKLLLLAVCGMALGGCWKEKEDVNTFDTLTGSHWAISAHPAYGLASPGAHCALADSLIFSTDSTGYYIYPVPCDSGDVSRITFNWRLSSDRLNLYYFNIAGNPAQKSVLGVSEYRHGELRLRGGMYRKRNLDGYFIEVKKDTM